MSFLRVPRSGPWLRLRSLYRHRYPGSSVLHSFFLDSVHLVRCLQTQEVEAITEHDLYCPGEGKASPAYPFVLDEDGELWVPARIARVVPGVYRSSRRL